VTSPWRDRRDPLVLRDHPGVRRLLAILVLTLGVGCALSGCDIGNKTNNNFQQVTLGLNK
jgi:hypothetical protein